MKWLLTITTYFAGAGALSAAEPIRPMPMAGVLPYPGPAAQMAPAVTVAPGDPPPTMTGAPSWNGSAYAGCGAGGEPGGTSSATARLFDWLSFRRCPPAHSAFVAEPRRAPLRTYFSNSMCGVGCANAYDCPSGCGRGAKGGCGAGGCGGSADGGVYIPPPGRMCGAAKCGGTPAGAGALSGALGLFGLPGGTRCGAGAGGCGSCNGCGGCHYSQVPMSDMAPYSGFTTTQSVGRVGGLTTVGATGSGSHFADPYRVPTRQLQYQGGPGATLAPAQTMPPPDGPAPTGTNPFPGPQGTLPYGRPVANP